MTERLPATNASDLGDGREESGTSENEDSGDENARPQYYRYGGENDSGAADTGGGYDDGGGSLVLVNAYQLIYGFVALIYLFVQVAFFSVVYTALVPNVALNTIYGVLLCWNAFKALVVVWVLICLIQGSVKTWQAVFHSLYVGGVLLGTFCFLIILCLDAGLANGPRSDLANPGNDLLFCCAFHDVVPACAGLGPCPGVTPGTLSLNPNVVSALIMVSMIFVLEIVVFVMFLIMLRSVVKDESPFGSADGVTADEARSVLSAFEGNDGGGDGRAASARPGRSFNFWYPTASASASGDRYRGDDGSDVPVVEEALYVGRKHGIRERGRQGSFRTSERNSAKDGGRRRRVGRSESPPSKNRGGSFDLGDRRTEDDDDPFRSIGGKWDGPFSSGSSRSYPRTRAAAKKSATRSSFAPDNASRGGPRSTRGRENRGKPAASSSSSSSGQPKFSYRGWIGGKFRSLWDVARVGGKALWFSVAAAIGRKSRPPSQQTYSGVSQQSLSSIGTGRADASRRNDGDPSEANEYVVNMEGTGDAGSNIAARGSGRPGYQQKVDGGREREQGAGPADVNSFFVMTHDSIT
jgi:hypothetical protein